MFSAVNLAEGEQTVKGEKFADRVIVFDATIFGAYRTRCDS